MDEKKKKLKIEALEGMMMPVSDDKEYFDKLREDKDKRRDKIIESNKDIDLKDIKLKRDIASQNDEFEGMSQEELEEAAARKLRRTEYQR